ncbi:hypothetical protein Moror_13926, partial [Moniliophthora roreri MCA 2997]
MTAVFLSFGGSMTAASLWRFWDFCLISASFTGALTLRPEVQNIGMGTDVCFGIAKCY